MGKRDIRIDFQALMNYKMSQTDPVLASDCVPGTEITLRGRQELSVTDGQTDEQEN